ncbi:MAG: Gfo/Idh/MocA family oxidoreductase [Acidobacteriaceae bacterium]|nr:Gfo/Idh/MocA family oxidoreductase [Acidobacteriaceae bacterium]
MSERLKIAIAGLGRMGTIHALHAYELARDTQTCEVVAVAEPDADRARRFISEIGKDIPVFPSVDELAKSRICRAAVVVTPTENHREHATTLISAGFRVLLEKPLTGTLEADRAFAAELDRDHPHSLMLAFQRRFDEPLQYAKQLMDSGAIGRVFKIYSALEDSNPAPNGYKSGGILPDMSIHNVDEILWLAARTPTKALAIGSRLYSHALTTCVEDFDDALLCLWFDENLLGQVQVTRNHVSGYRVETIIFGEEGQLHVGHFDQQLTSATVEAYGRRGRREPLALKTFAMRDYNRPLPEFADRFGPAYKAELSGFIECCRSGAPFPTTHRDGLRAQEAISAGMSGMLGADRAVEINQTVVTP